MNNVNVIVGLGSAICRVAASGRKKMGGSKAAADVGFLTTIDLQIAELQEQQLFGRANGYLSARSSFGRFLAESGRVADDTGECVNLKNRKKNASADAPCLNDSTKTLYSDISTANRENPLTLNFEFVYALFSEWVPGMEKALTVVSVSA